MNGLVEADTEKQNTELNDATAEGICDGFDWAYTDFQKQPTGISQVQVKHALHRGCSHPEEREKTTHMQAQELAVVGANKSEGHKRLESEQPRSNPLTPPGDQGRISSSGMTRSDLHFGNMSPVDGSGMGNKCVANHCVVRLHVNCT